MPQKDPEAYRKYKKEQMRQRRSRAKQAIEAGIVTTKSANEGKTSPSPVAPVQVKPSPEPMPAPATPKPAPAKTLTAQSESQESFEVKARQVADVSQHWLETRGWVVWECSMLNNDRIVIVQDELVTGYPPGLPVYTDFEMKKVADMPLATIRLVHAAKKKAQARLL